MALRGLMVMTAAAGAAFAAARQLLSDDSQVARLPGPARKPAMAARGQLLRVRDRFRLAVAEGRLEQAQAEAELTAEYRRKAQRPPDEGPLLLK